MKIIPISLKTANNYVTDHHRHHKKCAGCKFCIGLQNDGDELIGVAICGRPVSRYLDDGWTLEINRLCTDGTYNACSKLYGACIRIARNMGYKKIITYTLASEPVTSWPNWRASIARPPINVICWRDSPERNIEIIC